MSTSHLANPAFLKALTFAAEAHGGARQARKGTEFPYLIHPLRVAAILYRFQYPEHLVVAGLLHDTIEDTHVAEEDLAEAFGAEVARVVVGVSEPDKSLPWKDRKRHTLTYLRERADPDVLAVAAADKLDNVRSIQETLADVGPKKTWALFNETRAQQRWYYRGLADIFVERDPRARLFQTLQVETSALFPATGHLPSRLFYANELGTAEEVRPYLADPLLHWRPKYSAFELASAWMNANGIPTLVRSLLDTSPVFRGAELVEGFFEREVDLGTPGRRSQTDLLALLRLAGGDHAVMAVEGKAEEAFGELVSNWNDSDGKEKRLQHLCELLDIDRFRADRLRYQLIHRAASAVLEARRYGASHAILLVHSFSSEDSSLRDFQVFVDVLGVTGASIGAFTDGKRLEDVELRLAWVKDTPMA